MDAAATAITAAAGVALAGVVPPGDGTKVYKSECALSFQTPESEGGLYLNLRTFVSVAREFLDTDCAATGFPGGVGVYLHQQWVKIVKDTADGSAAGKGDAITKLAIGVEGGAAVGGVEWDRKHAVVLHPSGERFELPAELPCPALSDGLNVLVMRVLEHDDASKQEEVKAASWEFSAKESAFAAELPVVASPPSISPDPSSWKCSMCELRDNLWLNLSTGVIGCGRKQWDGSGGNSHAMAHFEETGKLYPLCVKLGTITAEGGDVFSYHPSEDDLVLDPRLGEHLSRFGIDVMRLRKTDKSMAELQLDLNKRFEFDAIVEGGALLVPAAGPGLVGLRNLGNSCYLNSVVQVMASLPEFRARYLAHADALLAATPAAAAVDSLTAQLAKVAVALGTDKYVSEEAAAALPALAPTATEAEVAAAKDEAERRASLSCVAPRMLRALAGRGHPEFSTGRQQDAEEYFRHLLGLMQREEQRQRAAGGAGADVLAATGGSLGALFEFEEETRLQCTASNTVRYLRSGLGGLVLPIPEEMATNKEEVEAAATAAAAAAAAGETAGGAFSSAKTARTEGGGADAGASSKAAAPAEVVPVVPFGACLAAWSADTEVDGLVSRATGKPETHVRRNRFAAFPTYLAVQMRRYTVGADWQPKKVTARVDVPESLDLTPLRAGGGLQDGEMAMPEDAGAAEPAAAAAAEPEPDSAIVEQLMAFGLGGENACKRAALAVSNANAEVAAGWLMEHMGDADINDPIAAPAAAPARAGTPAAAGPDEPPSALVEMLTGMGFEPRHAKRALRETSNDVERAADWLFSRSGDLAALDAEEAAAASAASSSSAAAPAVSADWPGRDGEGCYSLFAVISHIGKNTGGGHYVAHIKKNGVWCIFNDRKVAVSQKPPLGLGYLYFFRRNDAPRGLSDAPGTPRAVGVDHPVNAGVSE